MKYIFLSCFAAVLIWMIADGVLRPGPKDLEGNFKEVASLRNEQNTGPLIRVYAVTVRDTLWNNILQYGNFMPHTKYGNTKVYFFREGSAAPRHLYLGKENIDSQYKKSCIALYEKNSMGQISLTRYPFSTMDH